MISKYFTFVFAIIFAISLKQCYCHKNITNRSNWPTAKVTWYGEPNGPGCTGGACGYTNAVEHPPFDSMVTAAGPSLYKDGKGCGTCYKILCTGHPSCSRKLIKVVIADECPGCTSEPFHFDLSGKAYSCLAKPGHAEKLRNAGIIHVKFKRAHCHYKNHNLAFHMDAGANPYYVSFLVKFANGDGNFACIEIKPAGCDSYIKMEEMRSAVWKLNSGTPLNGPYDVRLTSGVSGKKIVAKAAIPAGWTPGAVYRSNINF